MEKVLLHLGSNVGDRLALLQKGIDLLNKHVGQVIDVSNIYETEPWGLKDQSNFLNLALSIKTLLNPSDLLAAVKNIEVETGRVKEAHWGPRVLDIDILLYSNDIVSKSDLKIPHQEIQNRNFVLIPLMEIAGETIHPILNKSIEDLYAESKDSCEVWIYQL